MVWGLVLFLSLDFGAKQVHNRFLRKPTGRVEHPVYDHGFRPNFSWIDSYGETKTQYFSNSLGLRDGQIREIPLDGGKPRILVIGDSFVDGVGIPWPETFPGRLQAALSPRGVEVLNAGCNSYTPPLYRLRILDLMKKGVRIDRVVLFLDLSDIKDTQFYEVDGINRARFIPYGPFQSQLGWRTHFEKAAQFSETVLEANLALTGAVLRNTRLFLEKRAGKKLGSRGIVASHETPQFLVDWAYYRGPMQWFVQAGIQRIQISMGILKEWLGAQGIPLTLVVYPWPQDVLRNDFPARAETFWGEWARQEGFEFLSLFPLFCSSPNPAQVVQEDYIPGDCHWNSRGHARVADYLLKNYEKIQPRGDYGKK